MKNEKTKKLVWAAVLLAICVVSQFFKNMSVYITGPIINACLIICVMTAGLGWACVLSIITPVTSFIITGSPIMSAIPLIMPCVMVGNLILVLCVYFLKEKPNAKAGYPISMVVGSVVKALFMGVVIALLIIPNLLPEAMLPKMSVFQTTFSITQLITSIIGSAYAYVIWIPLHKSIEK